MTTADRVWRARKRHDHIDAEIRESGGAWELCYRRNDRVLFTWRFASRDEAVEDAGRRLGQLQRAGWNVHW